MRILAIAGSLRKGSYNLGLLRAAQEIVPGIEIFDLAGIPLFNEELEGTPPEAVVRFKEKIRAADALLFACPEYNYSISGVLKNAIDWASRPYGQGAWNGKKAAIMSASLGPFGGARAQYHLRQIFVTLNIFAVNQPEVMVGLAGGKFDSSGNLTDPKVKEQIKALLQELAKNS